MMRKKREIAMPSSRVIPNADIGAYTPPHLIPTTHLTASDRATVEKIRGEFIECGVIDRDSTERSSQSVDEINAIMDEAARNAKYERELNPEYYDEEMDASLEGDLSMEDDWDNPILDGVDDYGNQVHENVLKSSVNNSQNNEISLRLESGEIVRARII